MYRFLLFVYKKPTISFEDFRTYYETKHIPLITEVSGGLPPVHKRHYVVPGGLFPHNPAAPEPVDFDCVTEIAFDNEDAFKEWYGRVMASGMDRLQADEEHFMDRAKLKTHFSVDDMEGA